VFWFRGPVEESVELTTYVFRETILAP